MNSQRVAAVIAGFFCTFAILNLPYGFYMILRCLATGVAIYIIMTGRARLLDFQILTLILVILIFNPMWKVPLGRDMWQIVDAFTAAFYFWVSITLRNKKV